MYPKLKKIIPPKIISASLIVFVSVILLVFSGLESGPSPLTNKCISCHNDTGYPNDTDLDGTTAPYKRPHNNSIMCEDCHGPDLHNVSFIQSNGTYGDRSLSAGCPDCHLAKLQNNSKFTSAPIIPALKHSSYPSNGSIWGTYWNSSLNASSSCYYCHGETKHNATALGNISNLLSDLNNTKNGSLSSTTWCADCHLNISNPNYRGDMWSPAPPLITVNNVGKAGWIDHSTFLSGGYKDVNCKPCHALNGPYAPTSLNYSHSLDIGQNGGPSCISCHYKGSIFHNIDIDAANIGVHSGMNALNATIAGLDPLNGACWACHDTDGNISNNPTSQVMGDIYNTPKKCNDCHLPGGTYYSQSVSWGGLTVSEHYYAGEGIRAGNSTSNISSCINCHENVSEMLIVNNDPDTGSFNGDGIRLTGGNRSFYHYGNPRVDLRTGPSENCSYCHQNSSTSFGIAMVDPGYNSSILNHSRSIFTPACTTCHNSGWLHNSTLTRPALNSNNVSSFCQNCHTKQKHNGTVDCSNCHINRTGKDTIHPIKYLQTRGTYDLNRTTAVNCTDCHQNGLPGFNAPIIPDPLKHSSNLSNGSIWGTYWTSNNNSCYYCHGDTKHNGTALGKISTLLVDPNNTRNGSLTATTWCADCHYNDPVNVFYLGNLISPVPPVITIDPGKTGWINHSGYLTGGYKDSICKPCHALNGTYLPTSLNYSHSLDPGIAGARNCLACHDLGSPNAPAHINFSAANGSVHFGMNSANATSQGYAPVIGSCWACHSSTGNVTSGHPDRYKTPKTCTECHLGAGTYNTSAYNALVVSQHFYSGTTIKAGNSSSNISSCITCHENVSEMLIVNNDPDTGSFNGDGIRLTGGNRSFYHYGNPRVDLRTGQSENCSYCHQNASTSFQDSMQKSDVSSFIYNHSAGTFPDCSICHGSGLIHNSSLSKPLLTNTFCLGCHQGGIGAARPIPAAHNSTMACWTCHQDPNGTMFRAPPHGMMIPQSNGTYLRYSNGTPANCTTCHVYAMFNTSPNTTVSIPALNHSTDPSSGRKWGKYWDNTSMISACYYCHQNELHKSTAPLFGNVSFVRGSNSLNNPDLANSTWCGNCHYKGSPGYNESVFSVPPPEILNLTGIVPTNASDGTPFYNHSEIGSFTDIHCENCHGSALAGNLNTTLNFSHSVSEGGGGANCISCHDITGIGAPQNKRVDASSIKQGIHKDLNRNAISSRSLDAINKACWACHGEGTEPTGHPARYKSPRRCDNGDCHSLSQSVYKEKMVYSHFRNASRNGNPGNVTNYNITTSAQCQECHLNSVVIKDEHTELAVVSHYGSKDKLVDSFNCRYCHIDKDNSEDWGGAMRIKENSTALIEFNKEKNKFTVYEGETIYLGDGYFLKLMEISEKRDEALIRLSSGNKTLDETSLPEGRLYKYETELVIDNSSIKTPVIMLNITSIFKGNKGFIQFEGFRIRKVHSERESRNNTNCMACHLSRLTHEKTRYKVIDREEKDNSRDIIYYTGLLVDFEEGNKSKIYYADEDYVMTQVNKMEKHLSIPTLQKYLKEGETWNIADNYALKLNQVSTESKLAWLTLTIDGAVVEDTVVHLGEWFNYTPRLTYRDGTSENMTVFTAKVPAIFQGTPNFVMLSDVYAISPHIIKTTSDSSLFGYNWSWLAPGETITTGRIPENLHAPELFTDQRGWSDCVKCHDSSLNLNIAGVDAISTQLGKHSGLNSNVSSSTFLSNAIDRACWACHTGGEEPMIHPPASIKPRKCASCHTYQQDPTYGAINVGNEAHGLEPNCEKCHYDGSHNLVRFQVTPVINNAIIEPEKAGKGEKVKITANAHSGYGMTIKAAEYFIDTAGISGNGTPLLPGDGAFDSQKEEVTGVIDTTNIPAGEHVIYIHAMERNNRWGEYYPVSLTIADMSYGSAILNELRTDLNSEWSGIIYLIIVLIVAYFAISGRRL